MKGVSKHLGTVMAVIELSDNAKQSDISKVDYLIRYSWSHFVRFPALETYARLNKIYYYSLSKINYCISHCLCAL